MYLCSVTFRYFNEKFVVVTGNYVDSVDTSVLLPGKLSVSRDSTAYFLNLRGLNMHKIVEKNIIVSK